MDLEVEKEEEYIKQRDQAKQSKDKGELTELKIEVWYVLFV